MPNTMIEQPLHYFGQWIPPRSGILRELEDQARNEQIPIVGPVVGKLLYMLARLCKAKSILEFGTATGYSTLHLAYACRHTKGRIITWELSEALAQQARDNIAREDMSQVVEVRCENVLEALPHMQGPVDMIFMDIEKEDYARALPSCTRLLVRGGLLVADNTGFKDAHAFNQTVFSSGAWETVNLWSYLPGHSPEHDGLCLALKA